MPRLKKSYQIASETVHRIRTVNRAEQRTGGCPLKLRHLHMTGWARRILEIMNVTVESNLPSYDRPALFLGNHVSYLDIPVLLSTVPVVFVAKKELGAWPLFGTAMRCVGTVFVERECKESRKNIGATVAPYVLERDQSIALFPSGTTTLNEEKPWRWGPFQLAKDFQLPVIPFRLRYEPLRETAYLLEDTFVPHLWKLLRHRVTARLEFHEPVFIERPEKDALYWHRWASAPF